MLAILDQSKIAWGDMANTLGSVSNQYRILKQQVANLARVIGNLLIPIVAKALPIINGVVIALQRMFTFIGNLIGVDWSGIMDGISSGYGDIDDSAIGDIVDDTDALGESAEDARKKAEKLKRTILGFDELNVLNDNSVDPYSGNSSGAGGDNIDNIGGGIDLSDEIAKSLADYESVWAKALQDSENKAQEFADNICTAFKQIWDMAEPTRVAISRLWDEGLAKLGNLSFETLKDFWNNFLKPVGAWMLADNAGLPRFFNITNDLLNQIAWERLKTSLSDFYTALQTLAKFTWTSLMDFYEKFLQPIAVWTMSTAIPQLVDIMTKFINSIDWNAITTALGNFWEAMAPFAMNVGQGLINFFGNLMDVGVDFINAVVPGGLNGIAEAISKISPEQAQGIGEALGKIGIALLAFSGIATVVKGISDFGLAIKGLSDGLLFVFGSEGIFAHIGIMISEIAVKFGIFGGKISEVVALVSGGAGTLTEAFSAVFGVSLPVIAAITGIALAIVDLWRTSETFRDTVVQAFKRIKDAIVGTFEQAKEAVAPLTEKIGELGTALYDFYEKSGLKSIVELVATLAVKLAGIIASKVIETFGDIFAGISGVLSGIVDILTGIVEAITGIGTLEPTEILAGVEKIANGIGETFGAVFEIGKNILSCLLEGILSATIDIGRWIDENIVNPFVNAFKNLFGIHSPSTVMAELGGFLMEGLLGGINSLVEKVVGVFTGIRDSIGEVWTNITDAASIAWEGISTTVGGAWDGLKTAASETFGNIKDSVTGTWDEVKKNASTMWDNITGTIGDFWDNLTISAGTKFESIKGSVSGAWDSIKENSGTIWGNVKETVGGIWDWLTGKSEKDFPEIQGDAKDAFESTEKMTDTTWGKSESSVTNALNNMKGESSKSMRQVFKNVESYTNSIWNITANNWDAIGQKVSRVLEGMSGDVSGALGSIASEFNGLGYRIEQSVGDLYWVGYNAAQSFANGFRSVHIPVPQLYISGWNPHTLYNGGWFQTPNFNVNWYAEGGFPNAGEVFIANENGPEMVGKMGRKNVVANNKQIADGIKAAVVDGMMEVAMMTRSGESNENAPYILEVTVKTENDEVLARTVEKGRLKRDARFNPSPAY